MREQIEERFWKFFYKTKNYLMGLNPWYKAKKFLLLHRKKYATLKLY